jgi:DNA-binding CsgD family transcriptional regulator
LSRVETDGSGQLDISMDGLAHAEELTSNVGDAGRAAATREVADFLVSASIEPSALVVEGEPGIGKTTLWLAAVDLAQERGFRVLAAHPGAAESVMAYAALADMLGRVESDAWPGLPSPQQLALDRVLLHTCADGSSTDHRAVAAAFLSVVEHLAAITPVLLAIDDVQWLDSSSAQVLAYAARRFSGRIGVLGTFRTEPDRCGAPSWLSMLRPHAFRRIQMGPLSLGALRAVVSERLGRTFSRPSMVRIHAVSGGNPFYALELARAIDGNSVSDELPLPATLFEFARARFSRLGPDVGEALLAAACAAAPTVPLVAHAIGAEPQHTAALLEIAESEGVIGIDGERVRFAHPLLAQGVYADTTPARRRSMHRRLALIITEPEQRARHLALAATCGDPEILRSLDAAADMARIRGAPVVASELLELAIRLGGDTSERRMVLAQSHAHAGDKDRARGLLEETIQRLSPGPLRARAFGGLGMLWLFSNSCDIAVELLTRAVDESVQDVALNAQLLLQLSIALVHNNEPVAGLQAANVAALRADEAGERQLISQSLAWQVSVHMLYAGDGCDDESLHRALELDDGHDEGPIYVRPRLLNARVQAWAGRLQQSHDEMQSIHRRCIERGEETELAFVAFQSAFTEIWRGDYAEAASIADDAMQLAQQLGGDIPLASALTIRSIAAAYTGRHREARTDAMQAIATARRSGANRLAQWPTITIGFLDVSLGDYDSALTALQPLMRDVEAEPRATEIFTSAWIPDAVEAMIHVGRVGEAGHLIDILESNGHRLQRPWMLAVGGRCRSMLLAACGDLAAANRAAEAALLEHEQLPMPFERARTQLMLGQLLRRQRRRAAATSTLRDAHRAFAALGAELWTARTQAELERTNVAPGDPTRLSPSERRVAELAGSGMTNRDVAAALFISPKTVEANLSRIYRKLDIHSRAELGRLIGQSDRR